MSIPRKRSRVHLMLICFLAGVLLSLLNGTDADVKADTDEVYENIDIFTEVLRQVEKNYVEPQDPKALIQGAIKGMVRSLDPHSSFLTKEEHEELMVETKGEFSGIGIEITIKDRILTVVSPIEGTPADKAGMKAGDKIIKVEGESTQDMTLLDAVKRIRGPEGSKVKLTVMREGAEKPIEFTITRGVIPIKSVKYFLLSPEIGYVRIANFQSDTAGDVSAALNDLEKKGPLKGLIIDLRNNPGGLLAQAIEVSDLFLDSGVIVSTKGRDNGHNIKANARNDNKKAGNYPMVILVNGGSASAAEIVAGALKDNKRALILGTRTFGKGSVQTILPLSDGSGLRLTTARYYTPSGKSIQSSGITPDIEIPFQALDKDDKTRSPKFIREENLKGHMVDEENAKDKTDAEEGPDTEEKANTDEKANTEEKVKQLLEKDNQVQRALHLLKSWEIFSEAKMGS